VSGKKSTRVNGEDDSPLFLLLACRRRRSLQARWSLQELRTSTVELAGAPDAGGRAGGGWDNTHREGGPTPRGSDCVPWMDARNGGSGRERNGSVSFPVARCGDLDAKSELEAGYRSGSVPQCGQSNAEIKIRH
jgi:hypothetical protein